MDSKTPITLSYNESEISVAFVVVLGLNNVL